MKPRRSAQSWLPVAVLTFLILMTASLLFFPNLLGRLTDVVERWFAPAQDISQPLHIAYAGTVSGRWAEWGLAVKRGAEMLVDEINAQGGIDGRRVVLSVFDDQDDPEQAQQVAETIAEDTAVVAVIGHDSSPNSNAAGEIYARHQLPAITPTATDSNITFNNEWYFRTIFDQSRQSQILAYYFQSVFGLGATALVYSNNRYGVAIAGVFTLTGQKVGLDIRQSFGLESDMSREALQAVIDSLAQDKEIGAILLAIQPEQAAPLVEGLRARGVTAKLVGTNAPAAFFFAQSVAPEEEIRKAAQYTEGMYMVVPFIDDTANATAQTFLENYAARYRQTAIWPAIYGYDSALLVIQALRAARLQDSDPVAKQRQSVREQLAALNSPSAGINGLTGLLYFDDNGNAVQPIYITQVRNGHLAAAPQQLQIVDSDVQPQLLRDRGQAIIDTGGVLLQKTEVIHTGIAINKISEIDEDSSTFKADFDTWFRFSGELDPRKVIFPDAVNPVILDNLIDSSTVWPERYQAYRVEAVFNYSSTNADLINGEQNFVIRYHHANSDRSQLIFVPDRQGMGLVGNPAGWLERLREQRVMPVTSGWVLQDASTSQEILNRSTRGNPLFESPNMLYSAFYGALKMYKGEVSLKRQLQALMLPSTSIPMFVILVLLFTLTWFLSLAKRFPLTIVLVRLMLGTMLFYMFEALFMEYGITHLLENYQLQVILLMFKSLWWLVPAIWVNALLPLLIWQPIEHRTGYPVPHIARTFIRLGVYGIASLCIMAFVFEQPLTTIWAASGVLTLILGFALQNMILDAFSGLMLNLERPFKIAHWIQVTNEEYDTQGQVEEINWRTTRIRTEDDNLVVIPNSVLSQAALTNFSAPIESSCLEIPLALDVNIPVERARRVLEAGARGAINTVGPVADPAPRVMLDGADADGVQYNIMVHYIRSKVTPSVVRTTVVENVMQHLLQAGLPLAGADSEEPILDWTRKADRQLLLSRSSLFADFDDAEIEHVADQLTIHRLQAGDVIIKQGEEDAYSMYGLAEGLLSIYVVGPGAGEEIKVGQIQSGDYFGEMSLLANEPRSATVKASTDCIVYEIRREVIEVLLAQRPELADRLSRIVAKRKVQNAERLAADAADREKAVNDAASALLKKMFDVFGRVLKPTEVQVQ